MPLPVFSVRYEERRLDTKERQDGETGPAERRLICQIPEIVV